LIIGVGTDLCQVSRIERAFFRWGERFERRIFTPVEIKYCRDQANASVHFAARFAAKEALFKALGTGLSLGIRWRDAGVYRPRGSRPVLQVTGRVARIAQELKVDHVHLSLTHEGDYALATVILEK